MTLPPRKTRRRSRSAADGPPFSTLARGGKLKRKPMKKRRRKPSETLRIYGTPERRAWIKSLPCLACAGISSFFADATRGTSHNAHTVTGGTGRKADYQTIIPLCASHHRRYDEHKIPFDNPDARDAAKKAAATIEKMWQSHLARSSERPGEQI